MYPFILSILLSAGAALATPIHERQSSPSVTIQNGTVVGSSSLGIDSFKGIPFAQPPVGSLRLRPPQPLTQGFGTIQATAQPRACPQQSNQVDTSDLPSDVIGELMNSPSIPGCDERRGGLFDGECTAAVGDECHVEVAGAVLDFWGWV